MKVLVKYLRLCVFYSAIALSIGFVGLLLGFFVVLLPPMVGIVFVAIFGVILAWASPDFRTVPLKSLRRSFFVFLVCELCVPGYYAIQIPGLPWISVRRASEGVMALLFIISISGSRSVRTSLRESLSSSPGIAYCVIGFLLANVASVFTSISPFESISGLQEIVLHWYIPFFVCLLVIRSGNDILLTIKWIAICAFVVYGLGIAEFLIKHRFLLDIFPASMLAKMAADNPSIAEMINSNPYRNGVYRASSIFAVPLSYAEFIAMTSPIGVYFMFYAHSWRFRILGVLLIIGAFASLIVSGSRGGVVAFLVTIPVLIVLSLARYYRFDPRSLRVPLGVIVLTGAVLIGVLLVALTGQIHKAVVGGGDQASSDQARIIQWDLAKPKILQNPITGHGLYMGAAVVGFYSPGGELTLDSYVIELLVECGVTGFVCFFGIIAFSVRKGSYKFLLDAAPYGTLGGALLTGMLALGVNCIVLQQRENHSLFFLYSALICAMAWNPSSITNSPSEACWQTKGSRDAVRIPA